MPLEQNPHPHPFTLSSILDSLAGLIIAGVEQLVTISGVENTSSQCCRNLGKCCQLSMWISCHSRGLAERVTEAKDSGCEASGTGRGCIAPKGEAWGHEADMGKFGAFWRGS